MTKYLTKQRKMLVDYFDKHTDEPVSASEIAADSEMTGISLSAIYRNLSALEKEGKLQKITKSETRETFYRYKACEECRDCLHLSCKKCGKTFHLNRSGAEQIVTALSDTENFSLDKADTIIYGICGKCNSGGKAV